jgi:hypothetical protein
MNKEHTTSVLAKIQACLTQIEDKEQKEAIASLLNMLEFLVSENDDFKNEIQSLKDEINRLKGEQGKPDIKANKKKDGDVSSEKERREAEETEADKAKKEGFKLNKGSLEKLKEQRLPVKLLEQLEAINGNKYDNEAEFLNDIESIIGAELTAQYRDLLIKYARYKKRKRQAKIPQIIIDRRVDCPVNTSQLPDDAYLKSHESKVVQDVVIKRDNVEFKRELYYSPSLKKCYLGAVPNGYDQGDFGPNINADITSFKYVGGMSIPKIVEFYRNIGTLISGSYISTRLTSPDVMEVFHREKDEMVQTAIEVSPYTQIDDTGTRVNGENHYTQILCNNFFTAFFTTKHKNRLTVLDVLRNFESRQFLLNEKTFVLLEQLGVSKTDRSLLATYQSEKVYEEPEILHLLQTLYGDAYPQKRMRILEACAISCYRQETGIAIVKVLVSDDAPQFKMLTDNLALCWIHNGRAYKRLNPIVELHQQHVADFLKKFWEYYRKLARYKTNPSDEQAKTLGIEFDALFSTKTGYEALDERIAKSKSQKEELLVVLNHPEVPLHNNCSEGGARVEKRRRDVSLQTKTAEGTKSKDTMMSIVETCKKLGISAYEFIYDRVNKIYKYPSLAQMIKAKTVD